VVALNSGYSQALATQGLSLSSHAMFTPYVTPLDE
jgi:hypothetical protein